MTVKGTMANTQWNMEAAPEPMLGEEKLTALEEAMCLLGWLKFPRTFCPRHQTIALINERYGTQFGLIGKHRVVVAFMEAKIAEERQLVRDRVASYDRENPNWRADLLGRASDDRVPA